MRKKYKVYCYNNWRKFISSSIHNLRIELCCGKNDHLHHSGKTFKDIVDEFCFWNNLKVCDDIPIHLQVQFNNFHNEVAHLVKLTKDEHNEIHHPLNIKKYTFF